MELSFCITCMNRFNQISKTLLTNLNDNKNEKVEFVLVDFNSSDGLKEYILNNKDFEKYLNTKQLRYFSTKELIHWHASIAKNTAHKLAKGKYVVNLDCDNYIGKDGGDFLLDIFKNNGDNIIISQRNNIFGSGSAGRISLTKENFLKLGGYDEHDGATLHWMDYMASYSKVDFGAHGYAANFIISIFDREFKHNMNLDQAKDIMKKCLHELKTRFLISQPVFIIKIIDKDGVRVIDL